MSEARKQWMQLPDIVFRDDFQDDALLFDPETDKAFRLNRTGVLVWNALEQGATVEEVIERVRAKTSDHPASLEEDVRAFFRLLQEKSLIGRVSGLNDRG
ncbi:PqqD family peptide modification chaperone [bacterium]|nr:PqqD family peptide modification chaperone [bacterium]